MSVKRILVFTFYVLLGMSARQYLTGWYSIIFQLLLWTGLIVTTICVIRGKLK